MSIIFLTTDMMFSSRVLGAASSMGLSLKIVPTAAALAQSATEQTQLVLLDLTLPGIELGPAVENVRAKSSAAKIIAFGPHVDAALLADAAHAGCDAVLTRSQFHQQYVEILKTCLA